MTDAISQVFARKKEEVWYYFSVSFCGGTQNSISGHTRTRNFRHCWISYERCNRAYPPRHGGWWSRYSRTRSAIQRPYCWWSHHSTVKYGETAVDSCWSVYWINFFKVAVQNDIDYATCLDILREARQKGLKAPVILMGSCIMSFSCKFLEHSWRLLQSYARLWGRQSDIGR